MLKTCLIQLANPSCPNSYQRNDTYKSIMLHQYDFYLFMQILVVRQTKGLSKFENEFQSVITELTIRSTKQNRDRRSDTACKMSLWNELSGTTRTKTIKTKLIALGLPSIIRKMER